MDGRLVVVAGSSGDLGMRIVKALIRRGARVRALVRPETSNAHLLKLKRVGAQTATVDYENSDDLTAACKGAHCVVSALSGLREVIVDGQLRLIRAAVAAGVERFIPSDYSIDYNMLPPGSNRNLDLRREFFQMASKEPIEVTSIFNGAFADLLTGQAPIVLYPLKRVLYWGDPDQPLDFTAKNNVADYTAAVALDLAPTPRSLHIAGDRVSARDLAEVASIATGYKYHLLKAGELRRLKSLITIARFHFPQPGALYPPYQGMQYLHNMFCGEALPAVRNDDRYPDIAWTPAFEVIKAM